MFCIPTVLCYLWKCSCCPISPLHVVRFENNTKTKMGLLLKTNILGNHPLMYLQKCSCCPIFLLQIVGFEIFQTKEGHFFDRNILSIPTALCYLWKCSCCPISPLHVVRFENNTKNKSGSFYLDKHFKYWQPYVIFKNAVVAPYFFSK